MRLAAAVVAVVVLALAGGADARRAVRCPGDAALGSLAIVRGGALVVVDLGSCAERTVVVAGVTSPVRWSPDGHWIAYGRGWVVPTGGGRVVRPLGRGSSWTWAPDSDAIAAVTPRGGVIVGGPGRSARHLLPDGWRARTAIWAPSGRALAVVRSRSTSPARPYPQEIWLVPLSGARRFVAGPFGTADALAPASFSPDGRWLLWWPLYDNAGSANADGVVFRATSISTGRTVEVVRRMLHEEDFVTWCGARLVVAAGFDRYTTHGKRLVVAAPPLWSPRELSQDLSRSWISPACSPDGRRVVASAGRNWVERRFGLERRSLWLVSLDGTRRRITDSGAATDELPRWSADGRSVLFVRAVETRGRLEATGSFHLWRDGELVGPIARLRAGNYYGHYTWGEQTDWYRPRVR